MRAKPVVKYPRVRPSQTAYSAPPWAQHAPSPTIDPSTNPCIEVFYNRNKTTPSIPTKPKPYLPCQVQHYLRLTLLNGGSNFCAQSAQHLVAQHMLNLPYAFHIYNNPGGGKEYIHFFKA